MKVTSLLATAGAVLSLSACSGSSGVIFPSRESGPAPNPGRAPVARMVAGLEPQPGHTARGSTTLTPVQRDDNRPHTTAVVTLSGAPANALLPWHVHTGACGTNGPVVGVAASYSNLVVTPEGDANLTITLPFGMPSDAPLYVNVHRSPSQMNEIISCGAVERNVMP